jgi:hypothetical protein
MVASSPSRTLADSIATVFILAYQEPTDQLENTLAEQGLKCEVLRQVHQPAFQGFSRSYLCLLNHCQAWLRASQLSQPSLIMEADFVPVAGFGQLPLSWNGEPSSLGIAWLYACAPQLYSVSQSGYAEGFATAMVAYIVSPASAKVLLDLAERIKQSPGAMAYSAWDSEVDRFLRDRQFKNYIPFRNYGEHGGQPNPEHRQHGLSSVHRADVLYGSLAFMPLYAMMGETPRYDVYLWVRLCARLKGIARLWLGKFLRLKVIHRSSVPLRLIRFALGRQGTIAFGLPASNPVFPKMNASKPGTIDYRYLRSAPIRESTGKETAHDPTL